MCYFITQEYIFSKTMQTKCRGSFANNMHYNLVGFRVQFILICTLQITETVLREQTFTPTRKTTLMIYV